MKLVVCDGTVLAKIVDDDLFALAYVSSSSSLFLMLYCPPVVSFLVVLLLCSIDFLLSHSICPIGHFFFVWSQYFHWFVLFCTVPRHSVQPSITISTSYKNMYFSVNFDSGSLQVFTAEKFNHHKKCNAAQMYAHNMRSCKQRQFQQ